MHKGALRHRPRSLRPALVLGAPQKQPQSPLQAARADLPPPSTQHRGGAMPEPPACSRALKGDVLPARAAWGEQLKPGAEQQQNCRGLGARGREEPGVSAPEIPPPASCGVKAARRGEEKRSLRCWDS